MDMIQERMEKFIQDFFGLDMLELGLEQWLEKGRKGFAEFQLECARLELEMLDETLFETPSIRPGWHVVRKAPRTLVTHYGTLEFTRRYYHHAQTGARAHLVDELTDIIRYGRVEAGLAADLCRLASECSYSRSTEIACDGAVSRQTVMQTLRKLQIPEVATDNVKSDVPEIHIQVDEDHVTIQTKPSRRKKQKGMVKLAVLHDPIEQQGNRRYIPSKYSMPGRQESNERYWERILDKIYERYGDLGTRPVYIHGDGAPWIKAGVEIIPNSRFVLDRYHLEKALHTACNRYKAPSRWRTLREALKKLDLPKLVETLMTCGREGICSHETAKTTIYYLVNNWEGIEITKDPNERPGASCAEGLVGHLLSDRLSRRPLSWSREGVTQMAALRAFISNGGAVSSNMLRTQPKITNDLPAKKKINLTRYRYCPMPSDALKATKRGTPLYRLCKAITNGGMGGLLS